MKIVFVIFLFVLIAFASSAQIDYLVSGVVKGTDGKVLPGASVFISGTKMASASDNNGAFHFKLTPGTYDLIVKLIGFENKSTKIVVEDKSVTVNLNMEEQTINLLEVKISADPNRSQYLKKFFDLFIGKSSNARYCKILNPEVLYFFYDKKNKALKASNADFLIIENRALGYRLKYLLESFVFDEGLTQMSYRGSVYFEDLTGTEKEHMEWFKNRASAYKGSPQHFFSALYHNNLEREGFEIANIANKLNSARPADQYIKAKIKKLMIDQQDADGLLAIDKKDSLSYWLKVKSSPMYLPGLVRREIAEDTLVHKTGNRLKEIKSRNLIYVIYSKDKEESGFVSTLTDAKKILNVNSAQLSQIKILSDSCLFSDRGNLFDPQSVYYAGYWGWKNVADSLPADYSLSEGNR